MEQASDAGGVLRRRVWWLRALSLGPVVALAIACSIRPTFRESLWEGAVLAWQRDDEGLKALGTRLGSGAMLFTSVLMVVQALAAPIPAVSVTIVNSWLFGPFVGGWLSIASATLAALLCFAIARAWGEPIVARLVSPSAIERANHFLDRHGAVAVLASRLVPFVPFDPISYVAGLSRMRWWTFAWTTFVGQIPAGLAYSYLAQVEGSPVLLVVLVGATLVALSLVGWGFRRVALERREKEQRGA